jgi:hypothetical protein
LRSAIAFRVPASVPSLCPVMLLHV